MVHRLSLAIGLCFALGGCAAKPPLQPPLDNGPMQSVRESGMRHAMAMRYLRDPYYVSDYARRQGLPYPPETGLERPSTAPYWFHDNGEVLLSRGMRLEDAMEMIAMGVGYSVRYTDDALRGYALTRGYEGPIYGERGALIWLEAHQGAYVQTLPESRLFVVSPPPRPF